MATPDLDGEIARAGELRRPLLVLIAESSKSDADDAARGLLDASNLGSEADRLVPVLLDLRASRNRAMAARFHALETPVLLVLSPGGVVVSRDEKPLTRELVLRRIDEGRLRAGDLDARLALLEAPVTKDGADLKARIALAEFLQGRQNLREAIPHLAAVAHADAADAALRVRAWVDLARAHLWIGEPEKGRHEAESLIAWGAKAPEARAGGELVLATQDAKAGRTARARQEFQAAIAAAPESDYARLARDGLARLPKGEGSP
ncbi:hypothetical protein [Aquisphaera insulae]|uniref:hypothetical protein n=1 Tax=Aquisphaera insulae TaxID=2712864 RepID=UPI0013ED23AC|nr:hypothetical protein [Aquisphaera insulae]